MKTVGVAGVVVTYRPAESVAGHLRALRAQVEWLVVVDNASDAASRALLAEFAGAADVAVIDNPQNLGLAAALNQGIARALELGAAWVATFDQDSLTPPAFIAGLRAAAEEHDRIGLVAPVYRDRNLGFLYSPAGRLTPGAGGRSVAVATTSGNLVRADALRAVGAMRADYFIDCVDFEFCLRLRHGGWLVWETPDVVLEHEQGRWSAHELLGWRTRMNDYPAERRYYQARNRLLMWGRYAAFDPGWCLADAWGFAREFVKLVLFGTERLGKIGATAQGAAHALVGRTGPRRRS